MKPKYLRVLALAGVLAITGAACGSNDDNNSSATDDTTATTAGSAASDGTGTEAGAAKLRSGLTALLQEHVYLAGIATGTALAGGELRARRRHARHELRRPVRRPSVRSTATPAASVPRAVAQAHRLLRRLHARARPPRTRPRSSKARTDLDGYRADFGAFLASANPNLPKDAVADALTPHVATLFAAIDAQAAKSPTAFDKLKDSGDRTCRIRRRFLPGAIVKQFPDKFAGDTESGSSKLLATLTRALQEHVYLAGIATGTALGGGDLAPPAATLDTNSVELSEAIGSVYGDAAGKQFLELWRKHIGFFVDYTTGKATKDNAKIEKARTDLDGYRADFGAFLASANPNLTKDAVADALTPHVASLFAAIDAQAAKDPSATDKLRVAAEHMPGTAAVLAGAIAKQFPDKFPG